jgi:hypothetical protein
MIFEWRYGFVLRSCINRKMLAKKKEIVFAIGSTPPLPAPIFVL